MLGIQTAQPALPVFELQALVAALTLTALFLGVTIDERESDRSGCAKSAPCCRGRNGWRDRARVNQPLTALANYGRSGADAD